MPPLLRKLVDAVPIFDPPPAGSTFRPAVNARAFVDRHSVFGMKVVLISYHAAQSQQQAGFHRLSAAYRRLGWEVDFVTAPLSWIHKLRGDRRFSALPSGSLSGLVSVAPHLRTYALFTLVHPLSDRARLGRGCDALLLGWYARRPLHALGESLGCADLIIFESSPAIVLAERVRELAPNARLIYRVSDDLSTLGATKVLLRRELEIATVFDLVSVPHPAIAERYVRFASVSFHPHGVERELFSSPSSDPYVASGDRLHACYVGASHFDSEALWAAARSMPQVMFHIIGPPKPAQIPVNAIYYGTMPFKETIPYITHADVGLFFIRPSLPQIHTYGLSLKLIQYSYSGLPTIGPASVRTELPGYVGYAATDEQSMRFALTSAIESGRRPLGQLEWPSWEDLARRLAKGSHGSAAAAA